MIDKSPFKVYLKLMLEYEIQQKNVPTIYELGIGEASTSLLIRIHPKVKDGLFKYLSEDNRLIPIYQQELNLPDYIPPSAEWMGWGFGPVLSSREDNDWLTYQCELPGASQNIDDEVDSWRARHSISATLAILFKGLDMPEVITNADSQQLLYVGLDIRKGMHGGSFYIALGKSLMPWLSLQPDNSRHRVVEGVMRASYQQMIGKKMPPGEEIYLSDYYFNATFRKPSLVYLSCPGDACGLDPEYNASSKIGEGESYLLVPHNVDNPLQQLTLLMGVAALHDEAKKTPV